MNTYGPPQRVLVRGEGALRLGRRRPPLPRPARRHRGQRPRPRPPRARRGGHRAAGDPRARLELLRHRAAGRAGRAAARPAAAPPTARGVLRQLRRRGERGGAQDHPAHRAHRGWSPPRARFHGRTMGALALTAQGRPIREPFEPLPGGVEHVPYGDADALRRGGRRPDVAAVVLEPVQGEAGVRAAPRGYLRAAASSPPTAGALLVLDEVQTGIGRTGAWFAHQLDLLGGRRARRRHRWPRASAAASRSVRCVALGGGRATLLGARPARQHLRRQPGRRRGRARRADTSSSATGCWPTRARVGDAAARRRRWRSATRWSPGCAGAGCCSAIELAEPVAAAVAAARPRRGVHRQRRRARTRSGSRRRWSSTDRAGRRVRSPRCRAVAGRRGGAGAADDRGTSCATTT